MSSTSRFGFHLVQLATFSSRNKAALPPMNSLTELFRSLATPTEIFGFTGAPIPNTHHYIGKDAQGRAAILFRVAAAPVRPASILLHNLRVEHVLRCRITTADIVLDDHFSVI